MEGEKKQRITSTKMLKIIIPIEPTLSIIYYINKD